MRAFVIKQHSHPSQISLTVDAPEPKPAEDEVVVEVFSAGLNYYDILKSQGSYQYQPPFPFILGSELAGRIAKTSPIPIGCPFKPGDKVFGDAEGAYADRIAVQWKRLMPLPENISYDQGAVLSVTWPTCYEALVGRAKLKPDEWVLVTASAGGVGLVAVQLAKALGAKVIAAAGSQGKLDVSKRYGGADYAVDYTKLNWQQEVLKITNGTGVDVVFDPVGLIKECLKCIAWKGRALVVGFASGKIERLPLNLVLLKNISIVGIHWGGYFIHEPLHIQSIFEALLNLLASSRVKPVIYPTVFPLEKVSEGLMAIEQRKTWGKVVVRVRDGDRSQKAKL
ncbi:hypothetical protein AcV5_007236 [Taiwanofungus camphoratus]|nr:hypothetical protein AcV5_007236 [Antrodia cinnamomea]